MTNSDPRFSAANEHDTCRFCGTVASPNDEPNCSTLQQAYAQTPTRPYGCPWFDKDSRKQWPKDRAEMSNLKDPERALVERCRADGFDYTAGCNLVDLVRRAGLTLSFNDAQAVSESIPRASHTARQGGWRLDFDWLVGMQDGIEEATGYNITLECLEEAVVRTEAICTAAQPPADPVEPLYDSRNPNHGRSGGLRDPEPAAPVETVLDCSYCHGNHNRADCPNPEAHQSCSAETGEVIAMGGMIERVARAMAAKQYATPWDHLMAHQRGHYLGMARTAIESMREATPGMVSAGEGFNFADVTWENMIDEALKLPDHDETMANLEALKVRR